MKCWTNLTRAYRQDGNKTPQAQFSHTKPLFSTWNIKSENKRFFLFSWDYYTVYSNQSHGTALFILMLIQKFQMFRDWHWSPLQSRALHTQSFKGIQPISRVLAVLLPSHTWMCFNSKKGIERWSEPKMKLWKLWLSPSYPAITSIYPVIYMKRPTTDRSQQADN